MRRVVLITVLILCVSFANAQKPDTAEAKSVKTKNVDGTIMSSAKDIIENLSSSPEFTKIIDLVSAANLADSLKRGTITFFAPTNKAFENLSPDIIDTLLLPSHKTDLINIINNYVISGKITSKDILKQIKAGNGQARFTTVAGNTLIVKLNENRNIVLTDENGSQSIVTRLDIEQSNGILFIINAVLLPKAKQ